MPNPRPSLAIVHGPHSGKVIHLTSKTLTIGRLHDNQIVIPDDAVSRYHAQITCANMQYYVTDLHSRNGTRVNNVPLEPQKPCCLAAGDEIQIAGAVAVLRFNDPAATRVPRKLETAVNTRKGLVINADRRDVWVDGKRLQPALSPQQFRFLFVLYQHADKVCGRDTIIEAVWPNAPADAIGDQMIDALAARIRQRIRALHPAREYVVTVRGHGFMFAPD